MMWQDWYLMLAGFGLAIALWPSIRSRKEKPTRKTCLFEALLVTGIAVCYATLADKLWLGVAGVTVNAIAWYILLFQKRRKR